jgi:hypothetical protein
VSSSDTVACDTPPKQLQNFGNTQLSLPKNTERFEGRSSEEWADLYRKSCEDLARKLVEVRAIVSNQQKKVDLVSMANSSKAGLDNTCAKSKQQKMVDTSSMTDLVQAELKLSKAKSDTHTEFVNPVDTSFVEQETMMLDFSECKGAFMLPYEFRAKEIDEIPQNENIAEPSLVEKEHQSEEAQDIEKKEDKKLANHQEAGQDIVQIVQPPYSPSMIDFDNKKILIRSDQTESTKGKNVVLDDVAPLRMIESKNSEVEVQKVDERKGKSGPRPKPTVKQMLDKYTLRKTNSVLSRLGDTKCLRSPSQPGGHACWQENLYMKRPYFPMDPTNWGYATHMYPRSTSPGFNHWMPYPTWPARYFRPEWIPSRAIYRGSLHEKRARYNQEARPRDAFVVRGSRSPVQTAESKDNKGGRKLVWMPVKRAEPKSVTISDNTDVAHALKREAYQSAEGVVNSTKTSSDVGLGSVQKEVICVEGDGSGLQLKQTGSIQFENEISSRLNMKSGGEKALVM